MIVIMKFDYRLNSVTTLCRSIWMSFFDTEELHAVMLAYAASLLPRQAEWMVIHHAVELRQ
jgi:hypothetical protein